MGNFIEFHIQSGQPDAGGTSSLKKRPQQVRNLRG
jgi:hypothetical protein